MYFIQVSQEEGSSGVVAITRSNVLSFCPRCGKAVHVDLQSFISDADFRLTDSSVMCAACSRVIRNEHFMERLSSVLSEAELMNEEECAHA